MNCDKKDAQFFLEVASSRDHIKVFKKKLNIKFLIGKNKVIHMCVWVCCTLVIDECGED